MAPSSPSLPIPIPIPWHICVPPAHPIVPSTPVPSPDSRLMTRGGGAEPTPEVRPDNGVWGRLEGRGRRGEEEPPCSPIPSVEATFRPALQAAPADHPPPARGDKDAQRQLPPHQGQGRLREDGEGGKSTEGRIIHGHSLSPFSLHLTIKQ